MGLAWRFQSDSTHQALLFSDLLRYVAESSDILHLLILRFAHQVADWQTDVVILGRDAREKLLYFASNCYVSLNLAHNVSHDS